ncbi:hypothetical protein PPACK8108_LOCUS18543 [Phakopsora pachyrhizi]|uniref:Uncharacterized protein n=1 Tax=Phakopsora pachyrhizi TaxID=170000 RepID=A0AAV0BDA7_PHAPC|nr:hypothetical protein PPACK8108_LOCUS18543 [Phakopsora pachyrhizi]
MIGDYISIDVAEDLRRREIRRLESIDWSIKLTLKNLTRANRQQLPSRCKAKDAYNYVRFFTIATPTTTKTGEFELEEHAKEEEEENQRDCQAKMTLIPMVMTAKRREREKTGMRMGRRRRKDGLDMVLFNMVREELRGRNANKSDWWRCQGFITVMRNKRVNSNSLKD